MGYDPPGSEDYAPKVKSPPNTSDFWRADGTWATPSGIPDITETVQDIVAAMLLPGTGLAKNYNDPAGTLDITVSGFTSSLVSDFVEAAQDAIANMLVGGLGVDFSYNDASNTLTLSVHVDNSTLEVVGGIVRVKDSGLALVKLSATGTRDGTTFLRGDNTWATPPDATPALQSEINRATAAELAESNRAQAAEAALRTTMPVNYLTTGRRLALGDAGCMVEVFAATAQILTIPIDSSVNFPVNSLIGVCRLGSGTLTISKDAGVTLSSEANAVTIAAQNCEAYLRKRGANTWLLAGRLA